MRLYLYLLLAAIAVALAVRGRRRQGAGGVPERARPPWRNTELIAAGAAFAVAAVLAYLRWQVPYVPPENCSGNFAEAVSSSAEAGMVHLDALVILSLPLLGIGWLRRDARWAIGGLLVIVTGFAACWTAAGNFHCPPGT